MKWFSLIAIVGLMVTVAGITGLSTPSFFSQTVRASDLSASIIFDWAVAEGYGLEVHSDGFEFPTTIAAVPSPGIGADAPIYYVGELNGAIKVVTRDGQVRVFASDFFDLESHPVDGPKDEFGLAGLCLAEQSGYIFATYAYEDAAGILRNGMTRFTTEPGSFGIVPAEITRFDDLFSSTVARHSHQIGPCLAQDGELYIAHGDGLEASASQELSDFRGKILRMDYDGNPLPDNPHFSPDNSGAANYVYARGFRNPFGFASVRGRIFVADNGQLIDRIVELEAGHNYLWAGSDFDLALAGGIVLLDRGGIATIEFVEADVPGKELLHLRDKLLVVRTLSPARISALTPLENGGLSAPPMQLVSYVGGRFEILSAMAVLDDGVYFAPLMPMGDGPSSVLRLFASPQNPHPVVIPGVRSGFALFGSYGCSACHVFGGDGGSLGPSLDDFQDSRTHALASNEYEERVNALNSEAPDREPETVVARNKVINLPASERLEEWVVQRLLNPRFDDQNAIMPSLGINVSEARSIARYILDPPIATIEPGEPFYFRLFPEAGTFGRRWLAIYLFIGIAITAIGVTGFAGAIWVVRRRRRDQIRS